MGDTKKLKQIFDECIKKVKSGEVSQKPSIADKLKLYAWYKQATKGDVKGDCPDDMTEKLKYDKIKRPTPEDKATEPFVAMDQNEKKVPVLLFPPLIVSTSIKSA